MVAKAVKFLDRVQSDDAYDEYGPIELKRSESYFNSVYNKMRYFIDRFDNIKALQHNRVKGKVDEDRAKWLSYIDDVSDNCRRIALELGQSVYGPSVRRKMKKIRESTSVLVKFGYKEPYEIL